MRATSAVPGWLVRKSATAPGTAARSGSGSLARSGMRIGCSCRTCQPPGSLFENASRQSVVATAWGGFLALFCTKVPSISSNWSSFGKMPDATMASYFPTLRRAGCRPGSGEVPILMVPSFRNMLSSLPREHRPAVSGLGGRAVPALRRSSRFSGLRKGTSSILSTGGFRNCLRGVTIGATAAASGGRRTVAGCVARSWDLQRGGPGAMGPDARGS
jgi:hypothetical protein